MTSPELIFSILKTASIVTGRLDGSLSNIKGISFSEFQLIVAIEESPGSAITRVDLARAVGLSPSGVTRALKPLERLGFVETIKDGRDARRSLARLTDEGLELAADARGVVHDTISELATASFSKAEEKRLIEILTATR